jgi:hypothetical protein
MLIEKYARAAASTARTPPNSPARHAALEAENVARVAAEEYVTGQAQRIAQLETKVNTIKRLHDAVKDERDAAREVLRHIRYHANLHALDRTWLKVADDVLGTFRAPRRDAVVLAEVHDVVIAERDELRARLAEIDGQEPVDVQVRLNNPSCTWQRPDTTRDEPTILARAQYLCSNWPKRYSMRLLYARPVPAIPEGWQTHTGYRHDYPVREDVLGREIELARADEKLFGVGFLVNGWHVPARMVSAFRPVPTIPNGCGACGDACKSRQSCRLADESPAVPATRDGWRPIETAPKDGSNILVSSAGEMADVSYYQNGYWRFLGLDSGENEHYIYGYLTHWMQIPAAPGVTR